VLLTGGPDPTPKIADFGLSRVEEESGGGSFASQMVVVGTRMYLPPEAADPYEVRTPFQDDVFALGVIWYQVLTGRIERPPYDFRARLHRVGVVPRPLRLRPRCLPHPSRRFPTAVEVLAALEDEEPPKTVPKGCYDVAPLVAEYLESLAR